MLIKKIKIENFRQYSGSHEIFFSTDKDKNVTLLIGDNGTGKTTISQAFLWCLYGETPGFLKKESILSKTLEDNLLRGLHMATVLVELEMEHSGCCYTITRSKTFYCSYDGNISSDSPVLNIQKTGITGETETLSKRDTEKCIEEILPKELSTYFFLTGEKIDSMSSDIKMGKSKDFANAVNTLLDLNYYKTAIKHLKAIKKEYDSSDFSGMSDEIEEINRKIETTDTLIAKQEEKLKNTEESISYFDNRIIDAKSFLKANESSKNLEIERQRLEEKQKNKRADSTIEINTGIRNFIEQAPYFFAKEPFLQALKTLKEVSNIKTDDIPERLHADLINWIQEHHKCICGTEILDGSKEYEFLESWKTVVPPEAIGTLIKNEKPKIFDSFKFSKNLYKNLAQVKEQLDEFHDEIEDLQEDIERITDKIANSEDTSQIQARLTNDEKQKNDAEKIHLETVAKLSQLKTDKEEFLKKRTNLLQSSEEGRRIFAYKTMTEKLISGFEDQYEISESEMRKKLVASVKNAFKEIYGTSFSINIDEKYQISTDTDLEKSTGQGMSVIYAFLAGLLDVIKSSKKEKVLKSNLLKDENETDFIPKLESYPLVFDAPFSALDKTRISSICKILPAVSEQIIILIKDIDGFEAKKYLNQKIGTCYLLRKIGNKDDQTEIVEEK